MSWRQRQLEQWLEWRAVEDAVTHAEHVAAVTVALEPEIPEAIQHEVQQAIDNRHAMHAALGVPTAEHRRLSDELRRRFGRTRWHGEWTRGLS